MLLARRSCTSQRWCRKPWTFDDFASRIFFFYNQLKSTAKVFNYKNNRIFSKKFYKLYYMYTLTSTQKFYNLSAFNAEISVALKMAFRKISTTGLPCAKLTLAGHKLVPVYLPVSLISPESANNWLSDDYAIMNIDAQEVLNHIGALSWYWDVLTRISASWAVLASSGVEYMTRIPLCNFSLRLSDEAHSTVQLSQYSFQHWVIVSASCSWTILKLARPTNGSNLMVEHLAVVLSVKYLYQGGYG